MLHVHLPFFGKFKRHQNQCMLHWFFQWGLSLISKGAIWHHRHGISNPFALYSTPSQVSSTPGLPRTRLTKSPVERFGFKRYHHYIFYHMFYMIDHRLYNNIYFILFIYYLYIMIYIFVFGIDANCINGIQVHYMWPSLFWDWCQLDQWYPIILHIYDRLCFGIDAKCINGIQLYTTMISSCT